jgi:hypothetical protein
LARATHPRIFSVEHREPAVVEVRIEIEVSRVTLRGQLVALPRMWPVKLSQPVCEALREGPSRWRCGEVRNEDEFARSLVRSEAGAAVSHESRFGEIAV